LSVLGEVRVRFERSFRTDSSSGAATLGVPLAASSLLVFSEWSLVRFLPRGAERQCRQRESGCLHWRLLRIRKLRVERGALPLRLGRPDEVEVEQAL
jgi:hypothetical protein